MLGVTLQGHLNEAFGKFKKNFAVEYGDLRVTYRELDYMSDIIADYIISSGIKEGSHIAILESSRLSIIYSMIGILKARCVFVPLEKDYPFPRIESMILASDIQLIFVDNGIDN